MFVVEDTHMYGIENNTINR